VTTRSPHGYGVSLVQQPQARMPTREPAAILKPSPARERLTMCVPFTNVELANQASTAAIYMGR